MSLDSQVRINLNDSVAARSYAMRLIAGDSDGKPFDALGILGDEPALWDHPSIALDLAYEEYCRRTEAGERLDLAEYAARFPPIEEQLQYQLLVHRLVASELLPGKVEWPKCPGAFAHFQLKQLIGHGATARVYLALDSSMGGRARVVKVAPRASNEPRVLARLTHDSIVDALYCGVDPEAAFYYTVMPLQGRWTLQQVVNHLNLHRDKIHVADQLWRSLDEYDDIPAEYHGGVAYRDCCPDRRSIEEVVIDWAAQIMSAIKHVHQADMIHCDVKPSNVLISWKGRALLLDLHAAQALNAKRHTPSGTIPFMSPEQLELFLRPETGAINRLTAGTDIFGWAATFYTAIVGMPPYDVGGDPSDTMSFARAHLHARATPVRDTPPVLSPMATDVLAVFIRQLQLSIDAKPAHYSDIEGELRSLTSTGRRALRWSKTHWGWTAILVVILLVSGILCLRTVHDFIPDPERDYRLGIQSMLAGDLVSARKYLESSIESMPDNQSAIIALIRTYLLLTDYPAADTLAIRLTDRELAERYLAYRLAASFSYDSAVRVYESILNRKTVCSSDYCNLAYCLMNSPRHEDWIRAEALLDKANAIDSELEAGWVNRIVLQRRLALRTGCEFELPLLEQATEALPRSLRIWCEVAISHATYGQSAVETHMVQSAQLRTIDACVRGRGLGMGRDVHQLIQEAWPALRDNPEFIELSVDAPERTLGLDQRPLAIPPGPLVFPQETRT